MLQAVKYGHLITWPGLTEDTINNHLKLTPATAMGHMNQRRQNIRSTSKASFEKQKSPDTDLGTRNHLVYAVVAAQAQLYTDLTGKFPVRSSKGSSYVMLCYIYDCNYIKVVPMKSRSASEWVKAYGSIQVRRGEPNARNEIRGSFARASRCRGYITRVLTRVMTRIHQDASAMTEC
jgi:hypothetical protein